MSSVNNYLCNSTVSVTVDNTTLGHAVMNMKSLVWNDGAGRKPKSASRSANCRCVVTPTVPAAGVEAWIEFAISLVVDTAVVKKKSSANALRAVGAGDADSTKLPLPLKPPTARLATKSLPSLHDSVAMAGGGGGETYRTQQPTTSHTVVVNVTSIQLDLQPDTQLWLRLTQPSAMVSPFDPVPLPQQWSPMQYQMSLRVPSHLVHTILTSQPPSLQLGADDTVLASATIYPTTDGCNTTAELKSSEGMRVGEVSVVWGNNQSPSADICSQSAPILTDTSLSSPTCSRPKSVDPEVLSPRHREMKILSFVEELEDWTDKQRLIVMEGLKEEEAARLAALQAQWETEVGGQVSEGRQLLQTLHNMRDELKHQQDQLRDNQYKLKVYKEELERVHRSKLQEFKDISRRMQDEFNHKLALIASDKAALEQDVEQLREENTEMKHKWREMEQTMMKDKRTIDTLSHELNVLKEQLNMEVESKRFFKEHCRKAEQEIHRLNCLRQEELEEKLLSNKKSLEHLAFQHIIVEKNDLRQDQELLNEIRQQLLRDPAANYDSNGGTVCSERTKDDRHIRRAT
ncbi:uncharacterized protein LOC129004419 isoform X2 [Macrosteles quadrilineatus]|uniref:uncharacterized protein LOC129004419 isoform X2 n=1 Tax=Macrosteles quadrilineatus TaxID=74068 RepID=UPI0023E29CA5|nr:uncharacterized protein LOC129004419 isoform X2 [Macrosteles quadrilineatus]